MALPSPSTSLQNNNPLWELRFGTINKNGGDFRVSTVFCGCGIVFSPFPAVQVFKFIINAKEP
jgi:hypothetical protein